MCKTNDYSQLTANTGIASISIANANLNGAGDLETVLTAGANGTTVKSVTIKSVPDKGNPLIWSQQGIVRLYIQDDTGLVTTLYREVIVPPVPSIAATPLPPPMFKSFETILTGDLKLQAGYKLMASTAVANTFNVIAEGVDWTYPSPVPDVCCNLIQETAIIGNGFVKVGNGDYNGSGVNDIFTADASANGSTVKTITIKALQNTHEGMIRLFISGDGGVTYKLMREVFVPQTQQSAFEPSFKQVVDMNFILQSGYLIGATTHNSEAFAITVEGESWVYP